MHLGALNGTLSAKMEFLQQYLTPEVNFIHN